MQQPTHKEITIKFFEEYALYKQTKFDNDDDRLQYLKEMFTNNMHFAASFLYYAQAVKISLNRANSVSFYETVVKTLYYLQFYHNTEMFTPEESEYYSGFLD